MTTSAVERGNPIPKALNKQVQLFGVHWKTFMITALVFMLIFQWASKLWAVIFLVVTMPILRWANKKEPRLVSVAMAWWKYARFAVDAGRRML